MADLVAGLLVLVLIVVAAGLSLADASRRLDRIRAEISDVD